MDQFAKAFAMEYKTLYKTYKWRYAGEQGMPYTGMASSELPNKKIFQGRDGIFDGILGCLAEYLAAVESVERRRRP